MQDPLKSLAVFSALCAKLKEEEDDEHGEAAQPLLAELLREVEQMKRLIVEAPKLIEESKHCECAECGRECGSHSFLAKHLRIHTKKKPFICAQCGYACSQRAHLSQHKRSKHPSGDRFQCDECDATYAQKSSLIQHQRTHDRRKQLACPHCEFTSAWDSSFRLHLAKLHPSHS